MLVAFLQALHAMLFGLFSFLGVIWRAYGALLEVM